VGEQTSSGQEPNRIRVMYRSCVGEQELLVKVVGPAGDDRCRLIGGLALVERKFLTLREAKPPVFVADT
jgi:hypothetical protein